MAKGLGYMALSALSLSAPVAACAHQGADMDCQVIGSEHWVDGADEEQICARFMKQLGPAQGRVAKVTLFIRQRGSINAVVVDTDGGAHDLTRDVMDRPLREQDLDKLAADVAAILQQ